MWVLVLALIHFSVSLSSVDENIYIIIDNGKSWEENRDLQSENTFFSLTNNKICCVPPYYFSPYNSDTLAKVSLFHGSLDPDIILSKAVKWSTLLGSSPLYSSQLNYQDWVKIESSRRDVFVIHPKDYCANREYLEESMLKVYAIKVHAIQMKE